MRFPSSQVTFITLLLLSVARSNESPQMARKSVQSGNPKGRSLFGPALEFGIGGTKFSIGGSLQGLGGGYPGLGWGWRPFPSPHLEGFYGAHNSGIGFGLGPQIGGHHHFNHLHHHQFKHHGYGYNLGWGWGFPSPYLPHFG